jgi:hypothetical protein
MATATAVTPARVLEVPKKTTKDEAVKRLRRTADEGKWLNGKPEHHSQKASATKAGKTAKKNRKPKATGSAKFDGTPIAVGDFVQVNFDTNLKMWTMVTKVGFVSFRATILEPGTGRYRQGRTMWIYVKYAIAHRAASNPPKLSKYSMAKRKSKTKGGKMLSDGVGPRDVEIRLSHEEEQCLIMRENRPPVSFQGIANVVFLGAKTRQAVQQIVRRAKRKKWRLESKKRYAANSRECPIEETPLPSVTRAALQERGIARLGDLASVSESMLATFEGIGSYGAHLIVKLLLEYGMRGEKPASFCVKCGAALTEHVDFRKRRIRCPNCKAVCEVEVIESPIGGMAVY